ncbi:MAG: hypothetical protein CBC47_04550 [Alphaproteobacteria bacterium TMED87]|nr:glycosyl transferase [Rhodospirillaceae bacterium]OUV09765.1 MAG: hypothetical protein CBC47_04550 [Alphaproteobacteria bacterium TMED87]
MNNSTNKFDHFNAKVCLQVLPELDVSGVSRGTIELSKAIVSSGRRALVASNGGVFTKDLSRMGVQHYNLGLSSKSPLSIIMNAVYLSDIVNKEGVSIIHARSRAPAWSAYLASKWTNKPLVTTFHGTYGAGFMGLKKKYNSIMLKGDSVIAISKFIYNHILEEYKFDSKYIYNVPRGVDLNIFSPNKVSAERIIQMSREWELSENTGPVIMLPGRLSPWKGQLLLLEAINYLHVINRLPENLRCLLVGPAGNKKKYRNRIEEKIREFKLGGVVQIIDNCKDIGSAYMLTDVVISASLRPEAFGRVVAEAQAMGRPVVAPNHGAASEIIKKDVTGWLFKPGNATSLAEALEKALSISQLERESLASIARDNIKDKFTVSQMIDSTLDIYENTIKTYNLGLQ